MSSSLSNGHSFANSLDTFHDARDSGCSDKSETGRRRREMEMEKRQKQKRLANLI